MSKAKPLSIQLSEKEFRVLEEFAAKKGMTKSSLLRQALRLYQLVDRRLAEGGRIFFENKLQAEIVDFYEGEDDEGE